MSDKPNYIKSFLKEEVRVWFPCFVLLSIALVVDYLYGVNAEAIAYTLILVLFVGSILLLYRFYCFQRKAKKRQNAIYDIRNGLDYALEPETLQELEYQETIDYLRAQVNDLKSGWDNERMESIDYYTTWIHQIKTPISVMQMILQSEDTEEHRQLQAELFRIEQYVEMVLSYIRLGSTTNDFVIKECDLGEVVKRSVRKYANQFVRKRIQLSFEPKEIHAVTDEKWLGFIVEQILSNAIKYTAKGMVCITISDENVIAIKDTGIGIAKEDLPRIFEKGFTGYNGRADKKSTGLGLYLCKQAADKLNIRLSAESTPGAGSVFYIDLNNR